MKQTKTLNLKLTEAERAELDRLHLEYIKTTGKVISLTDYVKTKLNIKED